MFLTRMALDITRPDTLALLASAADLRLAVLSTFAGGNLQPLFRLDDYGSRKWLVILSRLRPTMIALHQRYGYLGVFPSWETFPEDDMMEQATDGTEWYYELSASPGAGSGAELWQESRWGEWVAALGREAGFVPLTCSLKKVWLADMDGPQLPVARLRGSLRVTNQTSFDWSVASGLGEGRPFGAGLMTISRSRSVWD